MIDKIKIFIFVIINVSCMLQLHRAEDEHETDTTRHLPVTEHSSQLKMKAACNCGKKQADKDDPFNHKVS